MNQNIYKICCLKDNIINKIVVFNGDDKYKDDNVLEVILKEPELYENVFNSEELENIKIKNIPIFFSKYLIYQDDTIDNIKKKILYTNSISFEEQYLFGYFKTTINIYNIYNILTQKNQFNLTRNLIIDFLININKSEKIKDLPDKEKYVYDDLLSLNLDDLEVTITKQLGQELFMNEEINYPFVVNPYNIIEIDQNLVRMANDIIKTSNREILLSYFNNKFKILDNTIYLCEAEDICNFLNKKGINIKYLIDIYYPYLAKKEIFTLEKLKSSQKELLDESFKLINNKFNQNEDNISLFNDLFTTQTKNLNYINQGISEIEILIEPKITFNLSLEIIFKMLNSTEKMPLIKYNPSKKVENIYRLYSDKITDKGEKIPYLNKSIIFKLIKNIGKSKSVTCYINPAAKYNKISIYLSFYNNSSISIRLESDDIIPEESIVDIINKDVNPVINIVSNKLEQSGYQLPQFLSLYDNNTRVIDLKFKSKLEISKNINFGKFIGCISSFFNVEKENLSSGINLRYKRVSFFSEMESIEAMVIDMQRQDYGLEDIVEIIVKNFSIQPNDARSKIAEVIRNLDIRKTTFNTKKSKNKNNPGFITNIEMESFTNNITITVSNVNNIFYLPLIKIYLDSMLRLTQDPSSSAVPLKQVKSICEKNKIEEIDLVEDIEPELDKSDDDSEKEDSEVLKTTITPKTKIKATAIGEEDEDEKVDDILNTFFNSDSEEDSESEEEDDDIEGGADSENLSEFSFGSTIDGDVDEVEVDSEIDNTVLKIDGEEIDISDISKGERKSSELSFGSTIDGEVNEEDREEIPEVEDKFLESELVDDSEIPVMGDAFQESESESDAEAELEKRKDLLEIPVMKDESFDSDDSEPDKELDSIDNFMEELETLKEPEISIQESEIEVKKPEIRTVKNTFKLEEEEEEKEEERGSEGEKEKTVKAEVSEIKKIESEKKSESPKIKGKSILPPLKLKKKAVVKSPTTLLKKSEGSTSKLDSEINIETLGLSKADIPVKSKLTLKTLKSKEQVKLEDDRISEDEELVQNITGLALSNPNPFEERLKRRDPKLFKYDLSGKYTAYSRICPSNIRRQPVILTDAEKERIDREHPGSYKEAIYYGSDKSKKFWYICPRYWSLKENVSLTKEEVDSGKYGNVIPFDAKKVPKDASIFEFTDSKTHKDKDGKYVQHYPGFIKSDSHPDGLCLPCCFKQWDSKEQRTRREQCLDDDQEDDEKKKTFVKELKDDYIKGPDKFPIQQKRLGFLPIRIQKLLNTDNTKCQISKTNSNLKLNHPCLLRQGVEISRNQSFIACIADIYGDMISEGLTINKMREKLIESLTLDNYITLQNGNLNIYFGEEIEESEIDISMYRDSNLFKLIDESNLEQLTFFINAVKSFNKFKEFLSSKSEIIDYTYLWDLICTPNPKLFESGVNLIIIELLDEDITDNINIICPSNHFSNEFFDVNKKTIVLLKNEEYYEPIYIFTDTNRSIKIKKTFNINDIDLIPEFKESLIFIKNMMISNCAPFPSLPKVYEFKKSNTLKKIIEILNSKNITILSQVLNYNGKVVGIIGKINEIVGYLPCYPSSLILDLDSDIKWIDEIDWFTYENSKKFLEEIYKESDEKINAKPKILVKEEDLIVGFLTETNQFIMINPPLQELDLSEDLDIIEENNYILSDKISLLSKKRDVERERMIKNIRLEAKFFNAFRNLIRILLSKSENRELNKELYNLVNNKELMYIDKFRKVNELITEIVTDYVDFVEYEEVQLDSLNEIATCLLQSEEKCKDTIYCEFESGKCIFLIPKINLVNKGDNEITYFSKISDELVRFNRIRRFMFEEKAFLSFSKVNYNLNFNEILILQSLLTQEYFSNLKSVASTSGSIFNTYDNSNPNLSVKYGYTKNIAQSSEDRDISKKTLTPSIKLKLKSDKSLEKELSDTLEEPIEKKLEVIPERDTELQVTLPETKKSEEKEVLKDFERDELEVERETVVEKPESKEDIDLDIEALVERESKKKVESLKEVPKINCLKNIKQITSKWKSVIKKGITYINYELLNPYCSFQIIIDILKDKDIDESFDSLKIVLSTEYEKYESYRLNIGNIWKTEGKEIFAEKLLMGEADLETIIMSSDYYLTNIDYYLLSEVYELPIIFLSTAKFKETNKNFLIMNKSVDKNYYILIVPPIKVNEITQYKILNKGENVLLNLDMINIPLQTDLVIGSSFDVSVYIKKNDKKSKKFNVILEKPNKKVDLKKPEEELKLKKDSKEETLRERLEEQELLKALETLNISEVKKGKSL